MNEIVATPKDWTAAEEFFFCKTLQDTSSVHGGWCLPTKYETFEFLCTCLGRDKSELEEYFNYRWDQSVFHHPD